jgi:hypothetical protein
MTQALYAHVNNKTIKIKKNKRGGFQSHFKKQKNLVIM